MDKGKIILLNGPSSSGKSTIAEILQEIMDEQYLIIGLDKFHQLYKDSIPNNFNSPKIPKDISVEDQYEFRNKNPSIIKQSLTFHQFLAAFSLAGNNIISDTVIDLKIVEEHLIEILADFPVFLVGVSCSLEELEKREKSRIERRKGLAKEHYDIMHAYDFYDFEVDTSKLSPRECAEKIKAELTSLPENYQSIGMKKLKEKLP